nr:MAG TPA: hypothetical protein [Caudoviricetes sp.]
MRMCQTLDIGAYQNYTKSIRLGFLQLQPDIRPSGRELKQNYRYLRNYKQPALCGLFVVPTPPAHAGFFIARRQP